MRLVKKSACEGGIQARVAFLPRTNRRTQLCYSRRLVMFRRHMVMPGASECFIVVFSASVVPMNSITAVGIVTVFVIAAVLVRWIMRRKRNKQVRRRGIPKASTSSLSARTQARALDEAYTVMGPTTIREIEDKIATIDDDGNRRIIIRTRTMETVLGPIGPTDVVRSCRLTLPGNGPVIPLSSTEFEVFRDRTKLKLDTNA
jgi:hypothetical protein